MRFQKQLFRHKPEEGKYGDCMRTVIACFLDKNPEEVPNFGVHYNDSDEFNRTLNEYLSSQGYAFVEWPVFVELTGLDGVNAVLDRSTRRVPKNTYFTLTGKSKNNVHHVVICLNGQIVWDTSIDNSGVIDSIIDFPGYFEVGILTNFIVSES